MLKNKKRKGFTLVEILITLSVVSILSVISIPAYGYYVARAQERIAQADLEALSLNLNVIYQAQLNYPTVSASSKQDIQDFFKDRWVATSQNFKYSIDSDPSGYYVEASGIGENIGCVMTINQNSYKDSSNCLVGW